MKVFSKYLPHFLLILIFVGGCGPSRKASGNRHLPSRESLSSEATLGRIIKYLASDGLMGRDTGSEGIEKAALFLEDQLRVNQIEPYFTSYRDTFSVSGTPAYNIVGIVEGNDPSLKDQFIIVGAHYDHLGILHEKEGDSIANGANDNASGTATALELARYFGQEHTNGRSLIFAFFSAEEEGLLGSGHLATKLKERDLPLYLMLNFEMTGVPLSGRDYLMYVTGYDRSNLAEVCNRYAGDSVVGFLPTAAEYHLFERSDNFPFHKEFQVPSQTICTFDFTNFDQYHQVGDEVALMDLDHMATVVNTMIPLIEAISNSPEKEISYH